MKLLSRIISCAAVVVFLTTAIPFAQTPYKEFKRTTELQRFFTLSGDKSGTLVITSPLLTSPVLTNVPPQDSVPADTALVLSNGVIFHADRLTAGNRDFLYGEIVDIRIENWHDTSVVVFFTSADSSRSIAKLRQGNIISAFAPVVVDSGQFVRGSVFTVTGNVAVAGEVNRDVVTLLGKISTTASGVVRGGTATIFGQLDINRSSTVYGSMVSPKRKLLRRFQLASRDRQFSIDPDLMYNRVDGFSLFLGLRFQDDDSLLPTVWAKGGYAFESERWRYKFGIAQTINKPRAVVVGAEAYRRLASDDDWILGDYENMAFVLFAREDFKDYYEAEGGRIYTGFSPVGHTRIGLEYRNEATNWLEAHPRLWAIFGGNKRFRDNFSTIDSAGRATGKSEVDTTSVAGFTLSAEFDTRSTFGVYNKSAWHFEGAYEWSDNDLGSDFDFKRYTVGLTRYQRIHKESMLMLRGKLGGSAGYLPIHRRYYLGGLGSWQGYDHKEFSGDGYWLTNVEYRVVIPGSDFALSALWDCGQIQGIGSPSKYAEVKHSVGMAGYLGSGFRLSVAKRLDRLDDAGAKIYVRLAHHF